MPVAIGIATTYACIWERSDLVPEDHPCYVRGRDLTALVRIFALNRSLVDGMERGVARLSAPLLKVAHRLRRNTKTGSRQNIAAHYDLSNEFFTQMLDRTMMYSCAYFQRPDNTLEEASRAKLDLICRKLHLREDDHLVEIGSGWGGLACHAANRGRGP